MAQLDTACQKVASDVCSKRCLATGAPHCLLCCGGDFAVAFLRLMSAPCVLMRVAVGAEAALVGPVGVGSPSRRT